MKILIIDDQVLFAEGMKCLLSSFGPSVETLYGRNVKSGLNILTEGFRPDLILLDINLSSTNDYSLIDELIKLNLWIPVLIVSTFESPSAIGMAIEKGAAGFITKSNDRKTFIEAIQTVLSGGTYLPYEKRSISHLEKEQLEGLGKVTSRQQEILHLLSDGLLNKQIASELSISANTVKAHLHDIFRNLNVSNRTAAVKNAQKYGLI